MKLCTKAFVACRWADAHVALAAEYAEHELPHRPAYYTCYGFVLRHDDTGLTIASEVSEEGTYRGVAFIPAAMITDIIPLRIVKQRQKPDGKPKV